MDFNSNPSDNEGTVNEDNRSPESILADSVKELVGEGKKYSTVEQALESLKPKEEHIATLEGENAELRERLQAVENTIDSLKGQKGNDQTDPVDPVDLEKMIDSRVAAKEAEAIRKTNESQVTKALIEKYGDAKAAEQAYIQKANEMGLGVETMNELSGRSPAAVLAYFDSKPAPAPTLSTSTVNPESAGTGGSPEEGSYKYFQKKKAELGDTWYWSADTQNQIRASLHRLGKEKFYSS